MLLKLFRNIDSIILNINKIVFSTTRFNRNSIKYYFVFCIYIRNTSIIRK